MIFQRGTFLSVFQENRSMRMIVSFAPVFLLISFAVFPEEGISQTTPKGPASPSLIRGPYLQLGTPTSMNVKWRTDVPTDSLVRSGTDVDNLTTETVILESTTEHDVRIDGLTPGTKYHYAVGTSSENLAGGTGAFFFVTPPIAGTPKPTRLWVLGDSGTANAHAEAVRDGFYAFNGGSHPDLWLMLGDNAYQVGSDAEYQAAVFETYPQTLRSSVLWPTIGNHDSVSALAGRGPYFNIFTLPKDAEAGGAPSYYEGYYSFDYANIHFVCLDSDTGIRLPEIPEFPRWGMLRWLEEDLQSTQQDWIIAFFHHPPYSKGSHDSDTEQNLIRMREIAIPILEERGVDLVLAGHSHGYERSYLLDRHYGTSDTLAGEHILDGGDGRADGNGPYRKYRGLYPHNGAVYVVCGSSGRAATFADYDHPAMVFSQGVLGSMAIDINGDRLDAYFLNIEGEIVDSFTILKQDTPSPSGGWFLFY